MNVSHFFQRIGISPSFDGRFESTMPVVERTELLVKDEIHNAFRKRESINGEEELPYLLSIARHQYGLVFQNPLSHNERIEAELSFQQMNILLIKAVEEITVVA